MLSSTQEPYTDRKECSKIRADKIRELSSRTSINPDPNQPNTVPPNNNTGNYSAWVDFKLEQEANKYN